MRNYCESQQLQLTQTEVTEIKELLRILVGDDCQDLIRLFKGLIRPFKGLIRPLKGHLHKRERVM